MKAVPLKEAEGQLGKLIAEVYKGETIVIIDGDREVTLVAPAGGLNLEEDSPELEAELLKAVNGPHSSYSSEEMRAACERIVREKRG
jgi:antitoxin (DNA-binding transcriptional repressor) of toxin-antitoxin stability system